jgi:hypothetical protein
VLPPKSPAYLFHQSSLVDHHYHFKPEAGPPPWGTWSLFPHVIGSSCGEVCNQSPEPSRENNNAQVPASSEFQPIQSQTLGRVFHKLLISGVRSSRFENLPMTLVADDSTASMARKRPAPSDGGKDARKASLAYVDISFSTILFFLVTYSFVGVLHVGRKRFGVRGLRLVSTAPSVGWTAGFLSMDISACIWPSMFFHNPN